MFHVYVSFSTDLVPIGSSHNPQVYFHLQIFLVNILIHEHSLTDWLSFIILDIGNPAIEDIPVGTRLLAGLLQAVAVRAAGFGIVPLAALAPAVK
jgi:Trk-type K+ transport system membrane component